MEIVFGPVVVIIALFYLVFHGHAHDALVILLEGFLALLRHLAIIVPLVVSNQFQARNGVSLDGALQVAIVVILVSNQLFLPSLPLSPLPLPYVGVL